MTTMLYQGHGSYRLTANDGTVIYIDPALGEGYDAPANLIVITHDMAVAARAQRAYELYDGTLHEVEDPSALTHRAEAGHASDEAGAEQAEAPTISEEGEQ